jgi:hypothetical protein
MFMADVMSGYSFGRRPTIWKDPKMMVRKGKLLIRTSKQTQAPSGIAEFSIAVK